MIRSIIMCTALSGQMLYAQTVAENPKDSLILQQNATTNGLNQVSLDSNRLQLPNQKIKYLQVGGENDAWVLHQGTDRYYSQGVLIDYFFSKNGLNHGFWKTIFPRVASKADNYYGFIFRTAMYSPDTVQRVRTSLDHPYGGLMTLGMTCVSKQSETGIRLTTEYQIGMIGPAAMQEQFQKSVHKLIDAAVPVGWENQIPNDIAFNIRILYEHPLFDYANSMEAIAIAEMNAGTISNNGGVGFRLKLGDFHRSRAVGMPFMDATFNKKLQYYAYIQPAVYFIGDNAMLQGGVLLDIVRRRQYINVDNVKRVVGDFVLGYSVSYGNFGFTYQYHVRTAEFTGGKSMFWGGLSLQKRF
jgi:lipid A 3-O-deacylase